MFPSGHTRHLLGCLVYERNLDLRLRCTFMRIGPCEKRLKR
jgi:hypothetical protein